MKLRYYIKKSYIDNNGEIYKLAPVLQYLHNTLRDDGSIEYSEWLNVESVYEGQEGEDGN